MTDEEKRLEQNARRLLDQAVQDLHADTLTQLRHARAQAWRQAEEAGRAPASRRWWLPVGGAAVAGLALAVAATLWLAQPHPIPVLAAEDLELLAAKEGPDFYTDLDFYQWIAAHEAG